MNREYITDPLMALTHIWKHEVTREQTWPFLAVNWVQRTRWLAIHPKLMKHLIGAGLVQPCRLNPLLAGSWVYRLTPLGRRLVFYSSTATISIREPA